MQGKFPNPDLRILAAYRQAGSAFRQKTVRIPNWKLCWASSRSMTTAVEGEWLTMRRDHLLAIPPDIEHTMAKEEGVPVDRLTIHFVARPRFNTTQLPAYRFALDASGRQAIDSLLAHLADASEPTLHASLLCLNLAHHAFSHIPVEHFRNQHEDPRVQAAIDCMRDRLTYPMSNDELAAHAGMNTNAFIRFFKLATGKPPQAYRTNLRLERACMLLSHTNRSIPDIAEETGFCDRYHFTKVFTRKRRLSPAAFRRALAMNRG